MGWGVHDELLDERAQEEAEGGRRQATRVSELIREALAAGSTFQLSSEILCDLHAHAMSPILATAGKLRTTSEIEIFGSDHRLPNHGLVPGLVTDVCGAVNSQPAADPLFIAAYVMWRINWIHPFEDGNGRTARAASYLMLSVRLGLELQGPHPIPDRIKCAPIAYRRALEAADAAWALGECDVSQMQKLLGFYLEAQLRGDSLGLPPNF